VIDGADKLRDGARINLRAETGTGTPAAAAPGADKSGGKKKRSDSEQKQ
jgi:membrane fusion protein, multidrug efflux system